MPSKVIEEINKDAELELKSQKEISKARAVEEERTDEYYGDRIKYAPTPNFTDCNPSGTLIPINMVTETINNLSELTDKYGNLTDFIAQELKYGSSIAVCMAFSSEQVDALALIIEQIKKGNGFILGDMAGIGKGRVIAGVHRYCYLNGLIPVFCTIDPSLFSEMYKDINDIKGFKDRGNNRYVLPEPFIINDNQTIYDQEGNVVWTSMKLGEIKRYCAGKKLTKEYNCVWLTYSQIGKTSVDKNTGENAKIEFLNSIAPKAVFLFDESHCASNVESDTGQAAKTIIELSKGVTFASATYAKNPKSFGLYSLKTALKESTVPMEDIEKAIEIGGENISEYIASAMVGEGQMIRRERAYNGCQIGTIYKEPNVDLETAKEKVYEDFDKASRYFRELLKYFRSEAFTAAVKNAVKRVANSVEVPVPKKLAKKKGETIFIDLPLVPEALWNKKPKDLAKPDDVNSFLSAYEGKYVPYVTKIGVNHTLKRQFIDNLFVSLKSKMSADAIIEELRTQREIKYLDGKEYLTNRKPIIAIKNTNEAIFDKLKEDGVDLLQNDFSEYTKAVVRRIKGGLVTFKKVCPELFMSADEVVVKPKKDADADNTSYLNVIRDKEVDVLDSDTEDGGAKLNALRDVIYASATNIPLSPIDYFRDRIESEVRQDWDSIDPNDKSIKNPNSNYVFGEVTGRNYILNKVDGGWRIEKREKENKKITFNKFNSGALDALLLNTSGATGQSAHSSEKFKDKRPRVMYVLQFELDVNVEVQKRGRIFRTGMVNLPAYIYSVSLVPAEIRKVIALRKKLRKLDANTSANQVQSSEMIDVRDRNGNPIEDIFNKYGVEAFYDDFLELPENAMFKDLYDEVVGALSIKNKTETSVARFSSQIDFEPALVQQDYYDQINQKYREVVEKHRQNDTYQLEIETEDWKAALKSRAVVGLGNGNSEFSKPLFEEDKYTLEKSKTLSKDKCDAKIAQFIAESGVPNTVAGERPDKWHQKFLDDFSTEYDRYIAYVLDKRQQSAPDRDNYDDDETFQEAMQRFSEGVAVERTNLLSKKYALADGGGGGILDFFTPNKPCKIPYEYIFNESDSEQAEIQKTIAAKGGDANKTQFFISGKFLGYKFTPTSAYNKYSEGSIELVFALLFTEKGLLTLKPSKSMQVIRGIAQATKTRMGKGDYEPINKWEIKTQRRVVRTVLSGNLIMGLSRTKDEEIRGRIVRYTNFDGIVSTGVDLGFTEISKARQKITREISVPVISPEIVSYLKAIKPAYTNDLLYGSQVRINEGLMRVVRYRYNDDNFYLLVSTMKAKGKKEPSKTTSGETYNKYYFDKDFSDIIKNNYEWTDDISFIIHGLEKGRTLMVKAYKFLYDDPKDMRSFAAAMQYLWDNDKFNFYFSTSQEEEYNVEGKQDMYVPDKKEETVNSSKLFPVGEYEYLRTQPKEDSPMIPNDWRISEVSKGKFGSAILRLPIVPPSMAVSYNLMPANLSNDVTIKLFFSIFDEQERARVKNTLEQMVLKDSKSNYDIGSFVDSEVKMKIRDGKYIFGYRNIPQIGELLKVYTSNGDISAIMLDLDEQVSTRSETKASAVVDLHGAQKYLISLLA
jgi:hypothetical protein